MGKLSLNNGTLKFLILIKDYVKVTLKASTEGPAENPGARRRKEDQRRLPGDRNPKAPGNRGFHLKNQEVRKSKRRRKDCRKRKRLNMTKRLRKTRRKKLPSRKDQPLRKKIAAWKLERVARIKKQIEVPQARAQKRRKRMEQNWRKQEQCYRRYKQGNTTAKEWRRKGFQQDVHIRWEQEVDQCRGQNRRSRKEVDWLKIFIKDKQFGIQKKERKT